MKQVLLILETVTRACPGLRDALFLVSKARYLSGDIKAAISTLQHVVDNLDPTMAEAHLLMAQVISKHHHPHFELYMWIEMIFNDFD